MTTSAIPTLQTTQSAAPQGGGTPAAVSGGAALTGTGVFGALFANLLATQNAAPALTQSPSAAHSLTGQQANTAATLNARGQGLDRQALQQTSNEETLALLENILAGARQNTALNIAVEDGNAATTLQVPQADIEGQTAHGTGTGIDISQILLIDGSDLGDEAGLLARLTAKIQDLQQSSDAPGILFNLTPEQMTQLQDDIALAIETGQLPEPPEGFNFIVVALVPPQTATPAEEAAFVNTLPFTQGTNKKAPAAGNVNGKLDALTQPPSSTTGQPQGSTTQGAVGGATGQGDSLAGGSFDDLLDIQSSSDKFSALLKNAAKLKIGGDSTNAAQLQNLPTATKTANSAAAAQSAQASTGALSGQSFDGGSLLTGFGWDSDTLFTMGLSSPGAASYQTAGAADLVNPTLHARHASQGHPGTSLVAASLTKTAGAGENKGITLQLDPPELGRIEIRMEFGKDRTLKATIISEKPEAHMMLQRDAQTLERALQDSGLDTGSGLEFTLADDNQQFSQDGRHDGSRNPARRGGENEDNETVIESTMTWVVDPNTGHTHYSILV